MIQRCVFTLPDAGFPSEGATRPNKEEASPVATAIIENKAGFYLPAGIAVTDQEAFTAFTETSGNRPNRVVEFQAQAKKKQNKKTLF